MKLVSSSVLILALVACARSGPSDLGDDPVGNAGHAGGDAGHGDPGGAGQAGSAAAGVGGAGQAGIAANAGQGGAGASGQGGAGASGQGGGSQGGAGQAGSGAGVAGNPAGAGGTSTGGVGGGGAGGAGGGEPFGGGGGAGQGGAGAGGAPLSECDKALASLAWDFEGDDGGLTHEVMDDALSYSSSWPFDPWEWGAPTSGPNGCHSGQRCWATRLGGNYFSCQRAALVLPVVKLQACHNSSMKLVFYHWYSFWSGDNGDTYHDGGLIEISNDGGDTWKGVDLDAYNGTVNINPNLGFSYSCVNSHGFGVDENSGFIGASGAWVKVEVPLPQYLINDQTRVRFAFGSGVSSKTTDPQASALQSAPGWYIDDVSFESQ